MNIKVMKMTDEEYKNIDTSMYIPTILSVKLSDPNEESFWLNEKGDWIDLKVSQNYVIKAGEFTLLDLGVAMKLPDGFEAIIAPRSSTFKKYGLIQTNGIGIIDNTYCGNNDIWKMPVYATRDTEIKKGERLCQFRIQPTMEKIFTPSGAPNHSLIICIVEDLGSPDRGGFGTTGR